MLTLSQAVKDDATTPKTLGRQGRMDQTPSLLALTFAKFRTTEATRIPHLPRGQGQRKHFLESCAISVMRDLRTQARSHTAVSKTQLS